MAKCNEITVRESLQAAASQEIGNHDDDVNEGRKSIDVTGRTSGKDLELRQSKEDLKLAQV